MKKKIFLIFAVISLLLLLAACGKGDPSYHIVSFNSNGAEEFQSRAILHNDLIIEPKVPTRVGYSFLGWYNGDEKWNFETDKVRETMTLTAKWSRITFTVKFDSNGGSPVEEQIIEAGNFAVKPDVPNKQDCRFVGWYKDGDEWLFNVNRVTDYVTLVAMWEEYPTYTVEFDSNGGTPVTSQHIIEGSKVAEPTPPTKKNAKFLGWYSGDAIWMFGANTVTANTTLTARWEEIPTFTVTFNSSGGSQVEAQHVAEGERAIKPQTPDREQLSRLIGWYLGDKEWDFDTVITSDITLVARWQNIYKITFVTALDEAPVSVYVDEGSLVPRQVNPTKENMRFGGWYRSGVLWNFDNDVPSSDITLIARWEEIPTYKVSFDSAGGSETPMQYVMDDGYVTDPGNPSRPAYRFDGWYAEGKKWDFNKDRIYSDLTLTANWIPTVTVIFDTAGGSFINSKVIDKGTVIAAPTDPTRSGHLFCAWTLPDGTLWNFNMTVTEDITLVATWDIAHTVNFDTGGGVPIDPVLVRDGGLLKKPEDPKWSGWTFEGWYIAGTDTEWNFDEMTVTDSVNLHARWIIILPRAVND